MKKVKLGLVIFVLSVFAALAGCSKGSEETSGKSGGSVETVEIGVVLATSGPIAQTGTWVLDGHKAAEKEINDNGGFKVGDKTYKVKIVQYDSEGRAESATAATEKLINQDKVPVILGTSISSETAAMIPIAQRAKTPLITFVAASDILTAQGASFFSQAAPANKNYVEAGTKTMKDMEMKNIAFIYVDDAWGQSYGKLYPPAMEEKGLKIVATEKFAPEQKEFMTMLNKVKAKNPDGIVLAAETELAVPLLKQLHEVMPDVKIMESGGSIPEELIKVAPDAVNGLVTLSRAGAVTPEITKFQELFAKSNSYKANSFNYSGYDGIHFIVDAMQRAGTVTDKEKINKAIRDAKYKGLIGTYSFNEKGENSLVGNRAIIKDGKVIYQTVNEPLPK
ncbi:ABC transporter substrate-binding protein [Neobacillus rhizophilus]|uniref:ABC transporter substrate-binding protein n=1 Tax=Neobacillus rhizophilus TaxID=2833579 RepID=A0A942YS89_9BACI|nr:ABC transporter substrate-binding protein [Neobacillus rhizophilus]MBS4210869.1 ABC transporter substrate-binding protein [Neobacillus rhizophilus]